LICFVTAVDESVIHAWRIHTQEDVQFDRGTGYKLGNWRVRIDCVAPLPPDILAIFVEFDRRYRAAMALIHQGVEVDLKEARYTPDERRAHDFLDDHIAANPI
jgi:hypothetical protein